MTATQAPTPGPLSASDVKLLVKGDWLLLDGQPVRFLNLFMGGIRADNGSDERISALPPRRFAFIGRPDADKWLPWSGGEQPFADDVRVQVRFRNGRENLDTTAGFYGWEHGKWPTDIIAFRLAPTAPVEASGSERDIKGETFMGFRVAAWRYRQGDETDKLPHHYAEHWSTPGASAWGIQRLFTEDQLQQALNLRPQPSGETREQMMGGGDVIALVDQSRWDCPNAPQLSYANGWNDAVSARPLALGGQQGEVEDILSKVTRRDLSILLSCEQTEDPIGRARETLRVILKHALSTTPARAEAQDEQRQCDECGFKGTSAQSCSDQEYCTACGGNSPQGGPDKCVHCGAEGHMVLACPKCGGRFSLDDEAPEAQDEGVAGDREALALDRLANAAEVVRRLLHKTKEVQGPSFREAGISFSTAIDHARAVLRQRDALLSHPSPTPAADADRVRIAVEALDRVKDDLYFDGLDAESQYAVEQALAALKSEGK